MPVDEPTASPGITDLVSERQATAQVPAPPRRRWIRLAALAVAIVIVVAVVATRIGPDPEPADVSPGRPDAAAEPLGSDQHLQNLAARAGADGGALSASDIHLLNQAALFRSQTAPPLGSDLHLENQAAKPVPDVE
jgi:hypothetical protein